MSGRSGTATCAQGANPSPIKRGRRLPYSLLAIALILGAVTLKNHAGSAFPAAQTRSKAQWAQLYASLPLSFEANRGQTDSRVNFVSRGNGYGLFLTNREAVLTLRNTSTDMPAGHPVPAALPAASVLRMQIIGANPTPKVAGSDELPGKSNYLIGKDRSQWHVNVPTYAKVRYEGVYPGVDLVYYGNQGGELEYDFVVAPGANPKSIALAIASQSQAAPQIDSRGNLVIKLNGGNVEFHKPVVYQSQGDQRKPVEARYLLDAQNHVRFECGAYDHSQPLVIDPVLTYATYIGGTGGDIGYGIAVNSITDDAYIAGVTNSTNFPLTTTPGVSPYQGTNKGDGDAFVTQINSIGAAIIYSTYVGGSGSDTATAIALSSNGNAFVTGYTTSTDFPTLSPQGGGITTPFQQVYGGNTDAFVFELTTLGTGLVYSSYLGGSGADFGQGIAVDSSQNAYVTGTTQSTNFPIVNALQSINNGSQDAFVTKVNFSGEQLLYSTYLGGSQADVAQAIAVDSSNNAYITGYTFSTDFPLASALQGTPGGGADGFVTELNAAGSALTFSTYLGGSADDRAYGIALDGNQNIYVAGATSSANFPTTSGVKQTSLRGASNAFVSAINKGGASLIYSTYLGGTGIDQANSIAVTSAGAAFVTGFTNSSDFPTVSPVQTILGLSNNGLCGSGPCQDAFVTQVNSTGTAWTYSTYLGGNGPDFGQGIAVDSLGKPYVTGSTTSTNFPAIYGGSFSSSLTGNAGNAFIAKIDTPTVEIPSIAILPDTVNFGNETITATSGLQQILMVNPSTTPLVITAIAVQPVGLSTTVFQESDNCIGTIPGGGNYCTMNVSYTPSALGAQTTQIWVYSNAGGTPGSIQYITLNGSGVTAATAVTVQPTTMSFSSQAVGTISAPSQVATVTNTGTQPLNFTKISPGTGGDFAETDNCLSAPWNGVLPQGDSCTISVTFTPTASGIRTAALTISDNATGSPQSVLLSGTGAAAFTLSEVVNGSTNPTLIGSTQTTFVIAAASPTNFSGAITLTCSAGTTCVFNPPTIFAGASTQTSVLTVSNLTPTPSSNPYPFTVTGTSGSQSNTLPISLEFSDFSLTASPSTFNVESGSTATYNININPLFGLNNQKVSLIIANTAPQLADYTYSFSNPTPTVNSTGPTQVTLQINTTKYLNPTVPTAHILPRFPGGRLRPILFGLLSLVGLASLAIGHKRRARSGRLGYGWMAFRLATLSAILALNMAMAACRPNILATTGTKTGSYVVTVQATLAANTSVFRTVVLDLAVTQGLPPTNPPTTN